MISPLSEPQLAAAAPCTSRAHRVGDSVLPHGTARLPQSRPVVAMVRGWLHRRSRAALGVAIEGERVRHGIGRLAHRRRRRRDEGGQEGGAVQGVHRANHFDQSGTRGSSNACFACGRFLPVAAYSLLQTSRRRQEEPIRARCKIKGEHISPPAHSNCVKLASHDDAEPRRRARRESGASRFQITI